MSNISKVESSKELDLSGGGNLILGHGEATESLNIGDGYDISAMQPRVSVWSTPYELSKPISGPTKEFTVEITVDDDSILSSNSVDVATEGRYLAANGGLDAAIGTFSSMESAALKVRLNFLQRNDYRKIVAPLIPAEWKGKLHTAAFIGAFGTHAVVGASSKSQVILDFSSMQMTKREILDVMIHMRGSYDVVAFGGSIDAKARAFSSKLIQRSATELKMAHIGIMDGSPLDLLLPAKGEDLGAWGIKAFNALSGVDKEPVYDKFLLVPYVNLRFDDGTLPDEAVEYYQAKFVANLYDLIRRWTLIVSILDEMENDANAYGYLPSAQIEQLVVSLAPARTYLEQLTNFLNIVGKPSQSDPLPKLPASLAKFRLPPAAELTYSDTLNLNRDPRYVSYQYAVFEAIGGDFHWIRRRALGASTQPQFMNDEYDLRVDNGDRVLMFHRDETKAGFAVLLGYPQDGLGITMTGNFLVELLSDDKEHVYASYLIRR